MRILLSWSFLFQIGQRIHRDSFGSVSILISCDLTVLFSSTKTAKGISGLYKLSWRYGLGLLGFFICQS